MARGGPGEAWPIPVAPQSMRAAMVEPPALAQAGAEEVLLVHTGVVALVARATLPVVVVVAVLEAAVLALVEQTARLPHLAGPGEIIPLELAVGRLAVLVQTAGEAAAEHPVLTAEMAELALIGPQPQVELPVPVEAAGAEDRCRGFLAVAPLVFLGRVRAATVMLAPISPEIAGRVALSLSYTLQRGR